MVVEWKESDGVWRREEEKRLMGMLWSGDKESSPLELVQDKELKSNG